MARYTKVDVAPEEQRGEPSTGDIIAGKYRLGAVLGTGGMGKVFAATHVETEKRCALKWLHAERDQPEAAERFRREARAAGRVHHPGVVQIYDVGEHHGASFIVMERLDGRTLREHLEQGPLPAGLAVELLGQAARGVAAAHAAGVVHRDLKPENLVVTTGLRDEPVVKILDFGVSKISDDGDLGPTTRSGVMVGTPLYMAPERLFGEASDARADIYALAVILYETLLGELPYAAETSGALGRLFASGKRPPHPSDSRPELPRLLGDVVMHALELKPAERLPGALELADALDTVKAEVQDTAEPVEQAVKHLRSAPIALATTIDSHDSEEVSGEQAPAEDQAPRKTARWAWLAGAAVLSLAAAGLWWQWRSSVEEQPERATPISTMDPDGAAPPASRGEQAATEPRPEAPPPASAADAGTTVTGGTGQPPAEPASTAPSGAQAEKRRPPRPSKRKPRVAPRARPADGTPQERGVGRSGSRFDKGDFY